MMHNIPPDLRDVPQWVVWKSEERKGKLTKIPYDAKSQAMASSTDPETWSAFDVAWDRFNAGDYSGVGFVFSADDDFAGVDLDDCRDPETGELEQWAAEIVERFDSYAEVSPSGTGVKIFLRGRKPGERCRTKHETGEIEVYDAGRYFTVTGLKLADSPVAVRDCGEQFNELYSELFGESKSEPEPVNHATNQPVADDEVEAVVETLRMTSPKFAKLFDKGEHNGYASASEADLALCSITKSVRADEGIIDAVFRRSRLMRPKWEQDDYRRRTIAKALSGTPGGDDAPDFIAFLRHMFTGQFCGTVVDVVAVQKIGQTFLLVLGDGSKVRLGRMVEVNRMSVVRDAIADQADVLIPQHKTKWPQIVNAIIKAAEKIEVESDAAIVAGLLEEFERKCQVNHKLDLKNDEHDADILYAMKELYIPDHGLFHPNWKTPACCRDGQDRLYIRIDLFVSWTGSQTHLKASEVRKTLQEDLGFKATRFQVTHLDEVTNEKTRVRLRCWVSPSEFDAAEVV